MTLLAIVDELESLGSWTDMLLFFNAWAVPRNKIQLSGRLCFGSLEEEGSLEPGVESGVLFEVLVGVEIVSVNGLADRIVASLPSLRVAGDGGS